jgi:arylsulfatase A-like enzyme
VTKLRAVPALSPAIVLALGAWLALIAAGADLGILTVQKFFLGRFIHHAGSHLYWMIPVANLLTFALPSGLLAIGHRHLPRVFSTRVTILGLALMAWLAVLLLGRRHLHIVAIWCLALGLAWQTAIVIERRLQGTRRLLQVTLPVMLAMVALAAPLVLLTSQLREARGLARLPSPPADAPDVVFIILDTVRQISLSIGGNPRPTSPGLEQLARQGVLFSRAYAPSNWTPPSHASLFTGQSPHEFANVSRKPLGRSFPTIAEFFQQKGYATAGFSGNRIVNRESGLSRGFIHFEAFANSVSQMINSASVPRALLRWDPLRRALNVRDVPGRRNAVDLNERILSWLDQNDDRPSFVFINYFDAHAPYVPPPPFDTLFDPEGRGRQPAIREQITVSGLPAETIRAERDAYEGAITFTDQQLTHFIDQLERRGQLARTILVIAADHGEEFGEHGGTGHGHTMYAELLHVPLLIVAPGRAPANLVIDSPVTLADLPATIVQLAGFETTLFPGSSLASLWQDSATSSYSPARRLPFAAWQDHFALVLGDTLYIRKARSAEELYDLASDPAQKRNLIHEAESEAVLQRARETVDNLIRQRND